MTNEIIRNNDILRAASDKLNACKSGGITADDLRAAMNTTDRDAVKVRFNAWKCATEALYLAGRDYYLNAPNGTVTTEQRGKARAALWDCMRLVGALDAMKVIACDDVALNETILVIIGGNEKKNTEVGQYMPAPKTMAAFRGAFERWTVRKLNDMQSWTAAQYDAYNERLKAARKAEQAKKQAERKTMIEKAKKQAADLGVGNDEIEKTVTKICKSKLSKKNAELQNLLDLWIKKVKDGQTFEIAA